VDTRLGLASGGKGFTALAVVSLIEEGVLELSTTARSVLGGDLPLIDDRVTVEQLLAHRSGSDANNAPFTAAAGWSAGRSGGDRRAPGRSGFRMQDASGADSSVLELGRRERREQMKMPTMTTAATRIADGGSQGDRVARGTIVSP
jgi:beta-lactamase family protein